MSNEDLRSKYSGWKTGLERDENNLNHYISEIIVEISKVEESQLGNEEKTLFLNTFLPQLVRVVLEKRFFHTSRADYPFILDFLYSLVSFTIHNLHKSNPGVLETLLGLLDYSQNLYEKMYCVISPYVESELIQSSEKRYQKMNDFYYHNSTKNLNVIFKLLLNYFGNLKGFECLGNFVAIGPSIENLSLILRTLVVIEDVMPTTPWRRVMKPIFIQSINSIQQYSEEDLKLVQKQELKSLFNTLDKALQKINYKMKYAKLLEVCEIEFYSNILIIGNLEKKIFAISEIIAKVFQSKNLDEDNEKRSKGQTVFVSEYRETTKWLTSEELLIWLDKKDIVSVLFGPKSHHEIVKRSSDLLRFLYQNSRFDQKQLGFLWDLTFDKHEAEREALIGVIQELILVLDCDDLQFLYEKMKQIPSHLVDPQILQIAKSYAKLGSFFWPTAKKGKREKGEEEISVVDTNKAIPLPPPDYAIPLPPPDYSNSEVDRSKFDTCQVLEYLWELWQEPAILKGVNFDISLQSIRILKESLLYNFRSERQKFIIKSLENIKKNYLILHCCDLIRSLLESYPISPSSLYDSDSKASVLKNLDSTHKLTLTFFKSLIFFKSAAVCCAIQDLGINSYNENGYESAFNNIRIGSTLNFYDEFKARIDFLSYLLTISQENLTDWTIQALWDTFLINSSSEKESSIFCEWLSLLSTSWNFIGLVSKDLKLFIMKNLVSISPECYFSGVFNCFEKFFIGINKELGLLRTIYSDENLEVLTMQLAGIDFLWEIVLKSKENVFWVSSRLLKRLYRGLKVCDSSVQEDLIRICIQKITSITPVNETEEQKILEIHRCLVLIYEFIEEFEHIQSKNTGSEIQVTIKNQCKSMEHSKEFQIALNISMTWAQARDLIATQIEVKEKLSFLLRGKYLEKHDEQKTVADLGIDSSVKIFVNEDFDNELMNIEPNPPPEDCSGNVQSLKQIFEHLDDEILRLALEKCGKNQEETVMFLLDESNQERLKSQISSEKVKVIPKENFKLSNILSNTYEYFEVLFKLFEVGSYRLDDQIWTILTRVPINDRILNDIRNFEGCEDWDNLFDRKSPFKLLYSLQILSTLLVEESFNWKQTFFELGGVYHLYDTFINYQEHSISACRTFGARILNNLIIVLGHFFQSSDSIPEVWGIINMPELLSCTTSIIEQIVTVGYISEIILAKALDFLVILLQQDPNLLSQVYSKSIFDNLISNTLLNSQEKTIRQSIINAVSLIIRSFKPVNSLSTPLTHFWKIILVNLPKDQSSNCEEFFQLAEIVLSSLEDISEDFAEFCIQFVTQREVVEDRQIGNQDKVVAGYFGLVKVLLEKFPIKKSLELLQKFYQCLFELNSQKLTGKEATPKFKHPETRKQVFDTILTLTSARPENSEYLLQVLYSNHSVQAGLNEKKPDDLKLKCSAGYVGLRNFGSTCYLNSLMQQLYMMETLRNGLLFAEIKESDSGDNLLYQVKTLMAHLLYSEKEFFEPSGFCQAFKGYDGESINPRLQQDADEFLNLLFDKLEDLLKGTEMHDLLRKHVGGSLVHEIQSCEPEFPYFSDREEHFFRISLDVKNKKNLYEAFDFYVKADILEGENKYFCEKYNTKVAAKLRCLINSLENTVIVHLKRFEFDFTTMQRIKINEYCEFPVNINFKNWSKVQDRSEDYYEFELAGVLLHSGTADSGHYTSIVKDRTTQEWFKFDDRYVEKYNLDNLKNDCFGGETTFSWGGTSSNYAQTKNAYMLIYERKAQTAMKEELNIQGFNDIFVEIQQENLTFFRDLLFLDPGYYEFVKSFIVNFEFNPNFFYCPQNSYTEDIWDLVVLTQFVQQDQNWAYNSEDAIKSSQDFLVFKDAHKSPENTDKSLQIIKLGALFAYEIFIKSRNLEVFKEWIRLLKDLFLQHAQSSIWFLSFMLSKPDTLSEVIIECKDNQVREDFSQLLSKILNFCINIEAEILGNQIQVLNTSCLPYPRYYSHYNLYVTTHHSVSARFIQFYIKDFLKTFRKHSRNLSDYLSVLKDLSLSSSHKHLLIKLDTIPELLSVIDCAEKPTVFEETEKIYDFINSLLLTCSTYAMRKSENYPIQADYIELDQNTESFLTEYKSKVNLCTNFRSPAVESIILHLCWENVKTSFEFIEEFANNVFSYKNEGYKSVQYLKIIEKILLIPDIAQEIRVKEFISAHFIRNFYSTQPKMTFFDQLHRVKENNCGFVMNIVIWWGELMKNKYILEQSLQYRQSFSWIVSESFWHGYNKIDFFVKGDRFESAFEEAVNLFKVNTKSDEDSDEESSSSEIEVQGFGGPEDDHAVDKEDGGTETDEN